MNDKLTTSFNEADDDPINDKLDEESSKQLPEISEMCKRKREAVSEAICGDYTSINQIRNEQPNTPTAEGVTYSDENVNIGSENILIRHYYPENFSEEIPLFVYIHGGGWCFSNIAHRNSFASQIARNQKVEVISINHSLSPEFKFRVAIDELLLVYSYLVNKIATNRKVFLSGDSSGGNLAASLMLLIKEKKIRKPDALLLFYPVIDLVNCYPSHQKFKSGFMLDLDLLEKYKDAYCPDVQLRKNYLVSPIFGDLHHFPPTLVMTSQFDVLRNEGLSFAKKLDECGVVVRYVCVESAGHGFFTQNGLTRLSNIGQSIISDFLKYFK